MRWFAAIGAGHHAHAQAPRSLMTVCQGLHSIELKMYMVLETSWFYRPVKKGPDRMSRTEDMTRSP